MNAVLKYHRFLKEHPALFKGSHDAYTPNTIVDNIISQLNLSNKTILVLYNVEFVIGLVYNFNVDPSNIVFYSDHVNKAKIVQQLGVKYESSFENIIMKSRPILLVNPPYTNGEQDASEIYTNIINRSVDTFNPIAIGGVSPENLVNGGQKKKTLREKLFKKYGLKTLRFLDQKRDWTVPISIDTVCWVMEEGYSGPITVTSRHFNNPYIVPIPLNEYVDGGTQDIHDWLLKIQTADKIKLHSAKIVSQTGNQIKISKDLPDSHKIEQGKEWDSHNSEWRVAFGYMRCNTCAIVPPGPSIANKYRYINFGTDQKAARDFAAYMISEPVRFIMKLIYTSRTLDNPQLEYIPKLNLLQFNNISDAVLYQHWKVNTATQLEIKRIVGNEVPF
jgi:hypothetical protein